jgi:hypothetical protein
MVSRQQQSCGCLGTAAVAMLTRDHQHVPAHSPLFSRRVTRNCGLEAGIRVQMVVAARAARVCPTGLFVCSKLFSIEDIQQLLKMTLGCP